MIIIKNLSYVIVFYDISGNKVTKVMKVCRRYLYHIQNSVFMGEINYSNFKKMKIELENIIDENEDYIYFVLFENKSNVKEEEMGLKKKNDIEDDFL